MTTATTYTVAVSADTPDVEKFVQWLTAQGHVAKISRDTGDYINGTNTSNNEHANDVMRSLWESFCNA